MRTIRIKYSASVRDWPPGWYVWVRGSLAWEAVEDLRFIREKDASLALRALVLAGITTKRLMIRRRAEVPEIAFGSLEW